MTLRREWSTKELSDPRDLIHKLVLLVERRYAEERSRIGYQRTNDHLKLRMNIIFKAFWSVLDTLKDGIPSVDHLVVFMLREHILHQLSPTSMLERKFSKTINDIMVINVGLNRKLSIETWGSSRHEA